MLKKILIFLIIFFSIEEVFASLSSQAIGRISATVVPMTDINDGKKEVYEIMIDPADLIADGKKSLSNDEKPIIHHITSVPNTFVSVDYEGEVSSETDGDWLLLNLKNKNNEVIKMRLNTKNKKMIFDEKGKSEIEIGSEFSVNKKTNPQGGTFEASYYLIMGN